jgi:hypothetical protein
VAALEASEEGRDKLLLLLLLLCLVPKPTVASDAPMLSFTSSLSTMVSFDVAPLAAAAAASKLEKASWKMLGPRRLLLGSVPPIVVVGEAKVVALLLRW